MNELDHIPLSNHIQTNIHPTAIIHPKATIGANVQIGPYAIIGEHVTIGEKNIIGSHVVIEGWTCIGVNNDIATGAIIGNKPQDLKFAGEESYVCIGNHNKIREYATINRGTQGGGGTTRIGDNNLIMTSVHIAHDVQIGNHNVIVNNVGIAGHVIIDHGATIGFACGVHQFVKIGSLCMIGAQSVVLKDVPPYALAHGNPLKLYGVNLEGLRRKNYSRDAKKIIHHVYKMIMKKELTMPEVIAYIEAEYPNNTDMDCLLNFLRTSERGIYR